MAVMKAARYVAEYLVRQGVTHVFEMAGGAIAHLLDALAEREDIAAVSMHHEQAAAFAAEGYARASGKVGVAMATSGPGALNLVTGIGSCYFDSVPCVFLTGQVNTYEFKFDDPVRQNGFQETDIVSVVRPLTKYAAMVADASRLRFELEKAWAIAQSGRPGPVLLDIPMNVQRAEIDPERMEGFSEAEEAEAVLPTVPEDEVGRAAAMLREAARPMVLVGGGVRQAGATEELRAWLARAGIPAVCSLMGLDAVETDYEWNLGLIGSYGHRYANLALANCDCLLVLGSRLDTRQTGTRPETFAREASVIHVDIDEAELGRKVQADMAIRGHLKPFLSRLAAEWERRPQLGGGSAWKNWLALCRRKYPTGAAAAVGIRGAKEEQGEIDPNRLMERLGEAIGADAIVCLDVGQHQMWASQSLPVRGEARLLNAGGMGAMGFGLPAAIGAAFAVPGRRIALVAGDGGMQVNIQELQTIVHWRLPIAVFVLNNRSLGMVRQFQDLYFGGRQASTVSGYSCPDFAKVAEAYGIAGLRAASWSELEELLKSLSAAEGPVVAEIAISAGAAVHPKLGVGRPIEDMEPLLDREELRRSMIVPLLEEP
ncbi:thiamine pyrophosphate-binding protein [Cohnella cellulosilytica]|uniref:Thiamine pyrophosphate-binding protein n=2 Tax=Cohnella cellulosilytica TaxID=986710 RepID=A0ABW2FIN8_9BACL